MVEADSKLERALRGERVAQRERRQRLRWSASTASSYALDGLFIGLFVAAGAAPVRALAVFVAGAGAISASTFALYWTSWNRKFRDPSVIWLQVVAGVAIHLAVVALAPGAALPLLANVFTVFAFGLIWMSLRAAVVIWLMTGLAVGALLWVEAARVGAATSTPFEVLLTAACISLILGRCLVLNMYANTLRAKLAEGRRMLAASLEQIQELVHFDDLTKVYNRRTLLARLDEERSRARRTAVGFSVALMDLDNFKRVNDTYGHAAGDEALRAFAATVQASTRDTDTFGRYGGEEFLVILVAARPAEGVRAMERIRAALARRDWGAIAPGLAVTASVGVTGYRAGESVAQMLGRADAVLYEAKSAGRDRISVKD